MQAEALSNAIRLYCVVSNIHEKGSIAWYQDGEQIEEGRDGYKVSWRRVNPAGVAFYHIQPVSLFV